MLCHDCPNLDPGRMPSHWVPRLVCCNDTLHDTLRQLEARPTPTPRREDFATRAEYRRALRDRKLANRAPVARPDRVVIDDPHSVLDSIQLEAARAAAILAFNQSDRRWFYGSAVAEVIHEKS